MTEILLVEDAKFFRTVLQTQLEKQFGYKVVSAGSFQEAADILGSAGHHFSLALLDLNLPDAPNGEIVELVSGCAIPTIIFSGSFSEKLRDYMNNPHVVDYTVKESPSSLQYVLNAVQRFHLNGETKALIIDDSRTSLMMLESSLKRLNFDVRVASNGPEGLAILNEEPDIRLVLLDCNMPDMDGYEVCKRIRNKFSRSKLCVIGISAYGSHAVSAQFLKAGANDFLTKPYLIEEFTSRISLNMEALDHMRELDRLVYTDLVTELKNRRYFEDRMIQICDRAFRQSIQPVMGFVEIEDFRQFNEKFGVDAGDLVLKAIAKQIVRRFQSSSVISRYGGAQFAILSTSGDFEAFKSNFYDLYEALNTQGYKHEGQLLKIEVACGAALISEDHIEKLTETAYEAVTQARRHNADKCVIFE